MSLQIGARTNWSPSSLTLGTACDEVERRIQAARSLIKFTEYTYPRYQAGIIHRKIAEQLERVERGEIDRLMLLVPPRHGKSELASRRFPAYYIPNDSLSRLQPAEHSP